MRAFVRVAAVVGLWCVPVGIVQGQAPQGGAPVEQTTEGLRVFLDCDWCGRADEEHFRREITWVNYVRDRQVADVHLLITTRITGSGGREYTFKYIGLRELAGVDDEFVHFTRQSDSDEEIRRGLGNAIKLGLVRYAARRPGADRLLVTLRGEAPGVRRAAGPPPRDPWNLWVFRSRVSGNFSGESRSKSSNLNGSFIVSRVAEDWKLRFSLGGGRNTNSFKLNDSTTLETRTSNYNLNSLAVRSLDGHWSTGVQAVARRSTRNNEDLVVRVAPGIEYNVFPFSESTRRALTVLYEVGVSHNNYAEETIFSKLEETLYDQRLVVSADIRQPWGTLSGSVTGSALLNDFSKNSLSLFGFTEVRIIRGLNANLFGSYSRIRNQLFLPKGGVTDEEVLLRLKQLQTSFRYHINGGLSYTFGSVFNNVVNTRYGAASGANESF